MGDGEDAYIYTHAKEMHVGKDWEKEKKKEKRIYDKVLIGTQKMTLNSIWAFLNAMSM